MGLISNIASGFRALFSKWRVEGELDEELTRSLRRRLLTWSGAE